MVIRPRPPDRSGRTAISSVDPQPKPWIDLALLPSKPLQIANVHSAGEHENASKSGRRAHGSCSPASRSLSKCGRSELARSVSAGGPARNLISSRAVARSARRKAPGCEPERERSPILPSAEALASAARSAPKGPAPRAADLGAARRAVSGVARRARVREDPFPL